jgi:hypothetical protein
MSRTSEGTPSMDPRLGIEVQCNSAIDPAREQLDDKESEAAKRVQMIGRAQQRRAYWQREFALERFEEFRPEMRRRIAVEMDLLEGLEHTSTPSFILLRNYHRDAVHNPSRPKTACEEELADLLERISKAAKRRKDLEGELDLTPQRQAQQREELLRKIGKEADYIRDLQGKVREMQA